MLLFGAAVQWFDVTTTREKEKNMKWITWVLLVGLLWTCEVVQAKICGKPERSNGNRECSVCNTNRTQKLRDCLTTDPKPSLVVADNFNGVIETANRAHPGCIVFVQKNATQSQNLEKEWPQMEINNNVYLLKISKWHITKGVCLCVLQGRNCTPTITNLTVSTGECDLTINDPCQVSCLNTQTTCQQGTYDENQCRNKELKDKYIINVTATNICLNCDNPVKKPEEKIILKSADFGEQNETGGQFSSTTAVKVMNEMANLASSINGSSAELTIGGAVGILVRETEPADVQEVSFAYLSPNDSINIITNRDALSSFSRSVTVSKDAFEKAVRLNVSVPFAAVFRFINMSKDEKNSTVLGGEVLAVEMGTHIINLTDKISINFWNMNYKGIPSCHSWDGEGSRPNWTDAGCLTIENGLNITCQCTHLTFFAVLLASNETISSSDLKNLTIITQIGCGFSIFFLSIVLFMHFLLRKKKASKSTRILIHLVLAMFLLNLTFLINNYVAKLKSSVGCKIMAAVMHYSMLATFNWFAVQALHLCLQLYTGGQILIHRYILKVSIASWAIPSVIGIVLLITGKYGEQVIYTDNVEENVVMCWIIESEVHYIVNIGYYALVFLFTFTTFIIILSWLFCLRRTKADNGQFSSGKSIVTILGLCSMLGITWGFAFFAQGILLIPAYYIFTVLNSFQGFFLFIYYYNTSHSGETSAQGQSTSSISTLKTGLDIFDNPYNKKQGKST